MTALRVSVSVILMLLAACVVVMNWGCVIASARNKWRGIDQYHSTVPLISLLLTGVIAHPVYPFTPKWWIGIIPLMDIGNWIGLIRLPMAFIPGIFKRE